MDAPATPNDGVTVEVLQAEPVLRVRLDGALDITSEDALLTAAGPALDRGVAQVEVDCTDLRFCDSGGLRALVLLRNAVGDDGRVDLLHPSPTLVRMLEVTGLDEAFGVGQSRPE